MYQQLLIQNFLSKEKSLFRITALEDIFLSAFKQSAVMNTKFLIFRV